MDVDENERKTPLAARLQGQRAALSAYLRSRASGVLRYEGADDLVQDIWLKALRAEAGFVYKGDAALRAWLYRIADTHVADRHDHWQAQKRRAQQLLRVTFGPGDSQAPRGLDPVSPHTGPGSHLERERGIERMQSAFKLLSERDQRLVEWTQGDRSDAEMAEALGIAEASLKRARQRAFERLRKVYALVANEPVTG